MRGRGKELSAQAWRPKLVRTNRGGEPPAQVLEREGPLGRAGSVLLLSMPAALEAIGRPWWSEKEKERRVLVGPLQSRSRLALRSTK